MILPRGNLEDASAKEGFNKARRGARMRVSMPELATNVVTTRVQIAELCHGAHVLTPVCGIDVHYSFTLRSSEMQKSKGFFKIIFIVSFERTRAQREGTRTRKERPPHCARG